MATIGRTNGASFMNTPRLSYFSTAAYNTYFYSYTTSLTAGLETIGTLSPVPGATPTNCPSGRVLRENGRKLYPGANPGITTYMVGVYDAQTMLSGFIDPNAQVFQIYNTDKPTYLSDGVEPTLATTDRGPSMYTRGDVLGGGNLDISGNAHIYGNVLGGGNLDISGNARIYGSERVDNGLTVYNGEIIATGNLAVSTGNVTVPSGTITAGKPIRCSTVSALTPAGTVTVDASLAQVFTMTIDQTVNMNITGNFPGQLVTFIVTCDGTNRVIDFGGNFRTVNGGGGYGNFTLTANLTYTFSFVCGGSSTWFQIGQALDVGQ